MSSSHDLDRANRKLTMDELLPPQVGKLQSKATEVAAESIAPRAEEVDRDCCYEAIKEKKTVHRAIEYGGRNYWTRVVPELTANGAVQSVMTISQDVTARARAENELLALTAQLFRIQDEERRRIARELHDGTAQNLYGISVNLAKLNQLSREKAEIKDLIEECQSLGNQTLQEIRTLSYLLHPPLLDEAGLVSALQWYAQGFSKRTEIYVDVFAQPIGRLASEIELALFRIVQEALTNVRRHSGSETVTSDSK
jgi:signal transduction histidine kinase